MRTVRSALERDRALVAVASYQVAIGRSDLAAHTYHRLTRMWSGVTHHPAGLPEWWP